LIDFLFWEVLLVGFIICAKKASDIIFIE
jgi:hypothetical protein